MTEVYPIKEELSFESEGKHYRAIVTDDSIVLKFIYGDGMMRNIAVHTRTNGVTKWYVEHSCGINGLDPKKEDGCYSCDNGTFHEFDPDNAIHESNSKYSSELEEVIRNLDDSSSKPN